MMETRIFIFKKESDTFKYTFESKEGNKWLQKSFKNGRCENEIIVSSIDGLISLLMEIGFEEICMDE